MTILVDPETEQTLLQQITLPDNITLVNEIPGSPLKGKATKPTRLNWYARVQFADLSPAADFEHGISTRVTLWEKGIAEGIRLGKVNREGFFHAPFSDEEIEALNVGDSWLTLTVGNSLTEARNDHPQLAIGNLALYKLAARPRTIEKPEFYHGRILFEDGTPPTLDPIPWPGAAITVDFPYGGSAKIDAQGYFKIYLTPQQYENARIKKARKNIYIPSYQQTGNYTALYTFPISKLRANKQEAPTVKIPKPRP